MSASALRQPKWVATAPWNKGRVRPASGHIRVAVDVTVTPALLVNTNTFFSMTIASNGLPDW